MEVSESGRKEGRKEGDSRGQRRQSAAAVLKEAEQGNAQGHYL
jgi:hypothetical protein